MRLVGSDSISGRRSNQFTKMALKVQETNYVTWARQRHFTHTKKKKKGHWDNYNFTLNKYFDDNYDNSSCGASLLSSNEALNAMYGSLRIKSCLILRSFSDQTLSIRECHPRWRDPVPLIISYYLHMTIPVHPHARIRRPQIGSNHCPKLWSLFGCHFRRSTQKFCPFVAKPPTKTMN